MSETIFTGILEFTSTLINIQSKGVMYIDPNTGGLLFQLLAVLFGIISGIILIFSSRIKMIYFRIKRSMRGSKADDDSSDEAKN
jgi:hypothetical protein